MLCRVTNLIFILLCFFSCDSQVEQATHNVLVGGPCEGCEAIHEFGNRRLSSVDTLPSFQKTEPKLQITGTVFELDGKTPASNVIVYIYHTDRNGIYDNFKNEKGWGRRHGSYRGWIKTGPDGKYTFYTFRPAAYPNRNIPEHIHFTVKEPDKNEYYIADIVFDDDPLLTGSHRNFKNRAGSGLAKPQLKNGIYLIKRDIILGLNIPNYQ